MGNAPRKVAPQEVQPGQNQSDLSIPDQTDGDGTEPSKHEKTPKNTGFDGVFDDGRYRIRICDLHDVNVLAPGENSVNSGLNRDGAEALHHWLHLIAKSDERSVAAVLVDFVAETLGTDALAKLFEAVSEAAKNVTPKL